MLNGLDLFSGIGGLSLALAPWVRPVAYCEIERYAQAVLLSRMSGGLLPPAPIWDDVRTLRAESLPSIDIVTGGFPCQDISVAGRGEGLAGKRSALFYEIARLVRDLRPSLVFLENVPAISVRGLDRVTAEFSALGYDCRWDMLRAFDVGAPHLRERWWLLATDTNGGELRNEQGRSGWASRLGQTEPKHDGTGGNLAHADNTEYSAIREVSKGSPVEPSGADWWSVEPNVGRVANGVPRRVDRLRALGNAVVPAQAREAFRRLSGL